MSPRSTLNSCGQLVERVAAQPLARLGDPRVVLHLEQAGALAGLRVQSWASSSSASTTMVRNFRQPNSLPSRPVRVCRKKTGPPSCELDPQRRRTGSSGLKARISARRADDVEGPLAAAGGVGRARRVDVHQRKSADRADPDPLARDVGDAGCDDDLDVVLLQVPDDLAQLRGGGERAAGEEDDVGVRGADHRGHVLAGADDGSRRRSPRASRGRAAARRRPGSPATTRGAARRRSRRRAPAEPAISTRCWRWPCRRARCRAWRSTPAADEQGRHAEAEGEQEEAAGELELREVAGDADQPGGEQAGVEHPLVLVGAGAEDVVAVAADGGDDHQPAQQHERARDLEGRRDVGAVVEDVEPVATQDGEREDADHHEQVEDQGRDREVSERATRRTERSCPLDRKKRHTSPHAMPRACWCRARDPRDAPRRTLHDGSRRRSRSRTLGGFVTPKQTASWDFGYTSEMAGGGCLWGGDRGHTRVMTTARDRDPRGRVVVPGPTAVGGRRGTSLPRRARSATSIGRRGDRPRLRRRRDVTSRPRRCARTAARRGSPRGGGPSTRTTPRTECTATPRPRCRMRTPGSCLHIGAGWGDLRVAPPRSVQPIG